MSMPQQIQAVYERSTCLFDNQKISKALDKMAATITKELYDKNPVLLCVMIGGMVPMGNLLLRLNFPLEVDYIHATRYMGKTQGSKLHWKVEPTISLRARSVLIVDDILDGGVTLAALLDYVESHNAHKAYTAVLVNKQCPREANGLQQADFTALNVENRYVFGYGMDYNNYLRNAPGIYVVDPQDE